jgi:phytoene synthase
MTKKTGSSYCARLVRRLDYDRFLCALFAPAGRREALFALYALNAELARVRESVSEPLLGAIRLQWWRERIDEIFEQGPTGRHASELVAALAAVIGERRLPREPFESLLDAREFDLSDEPPEDLAALEAYAEATAGSLAVLTLEALAPQEEDDEGNDPARAAALAAAREAGAAFGLLGLLRSVPFHARWNRVVLPRSLLERAGVRPSDVVEGRARDRLAPVAAEIAAAAASRLSVARAAAATVPGWALPSLLPGALARSYLRRLERRRYDLFDPGLTPARPLRQIRLLSAAVTGRY